MRLKVYDTDETMRFRVQSDSDPAKQYLVDLLENDGNGWCECDHFHFTCYPNWRVEEIMGTNEVRDRDETKPTCCKHITAAKRYWAKQALRHASKKLHQRPI